jgi:predicted phage tail component-like protein
MGEAGELKLHNTKKSMSINGVNIEDTLPEFAVVSVSGRERLDNEVNSTDRGLNDGSVYNYKRYQSRTLTISFIINCGEFYESTEALNQMRILNGLLDVENAQIIFDDEPDVYYVGTPTGSANVAISLGVASGSFDIYCADPFKYSVEEFSHETHPTVVQYDSTKKEFLVNYRGTAKSYPTLVSNFKNYSNVDASGTTHDITDLAKADCGYVSFFNANKKVIQIGDPDELDVETGAYSKSQALASQDFNTSDYAYSGDIATQWPLTGAGSLAVSQCYIPVTVSPTSAQVLSVWSYSDRPYVYYSVTLYSSERTETSVKITAVVDVRLHNSGSWIGSGYGVKCHLYAPGGGWWDITVKANSDSTWRGTGWRTYSNTWTISSGITADTTSLDFQFYANGTGGCSCGNIGNKYMSFGISKYGENETEKYYLAPSSYGSSSTGWHGPTITRTIPADASSATGAKEWTLTYSQKLAISNGGSAYKEMGAFQCQLLAGSTAVAQVRIEKDSSGKTGTVKLSVLDPSMSGVLYNFKSYTIDLSYKNKNFGSTTSAIKTSVIKCELLSDGGYRYTFTIAGKSNIYTIYYPVGAAVQSVTNVAFSFLQYKSNTAIFYNGIHSVKFTKDDCETTREIDNKFGNGDKMYADCKNGDIYLNDVRTPSLGALGNDWEQFYFKQGINQIGVSYSSWVTDENAPTFDIKFREVYL